MNFKEAFDPPSGGYDRFRFFRNHLVVSFGLFGAAVTLIPKVGPLPFDASPLGGYVALGLACLYDLTRTNGAAKSMDTGSPME